MHSYQIAAHDGRAGGLHILQKNRMTPLTAFDTNILRLHDLRNGTNLKNSTPISAWSKLTTAGTAPYFGSSSGAAALIPEVAIPLP